MPGTEELLRGLTLIVVLGIGAQWLAWRLKLPSILLLLVFGFVAGPVLGVLRPGEIFGENLIMPVVSLSVALILFEGGLSLRVRELKQIGRVVRNLVTVGALVTWVLCTLAARLFLVDSRGDSPTPLAWPIAILLGAVLVVTGPTVIIPMLRRVQPSSRLASILRWEGIVIDPIGATLAVLVFEAIYAFPEHGFSTGETLWNFASTMAIGGAMGYLGAAVLYLMLRRYLIPDFLHGVSALMLVVGVFTTANSLKPESGVFAVTVMGIVLANQRSVSVRTIVEFKEHLQVLLISSLFILLSANLEKEHFSHFNSGALLFLAGIILVARPLMVAASTIRSGLDWRGKVFLSMMAPRGIVAAAVASVFALRLRNAWTDQPDDLPPYLQEVVAQADLLVPYTFMVIVATVTFYGLGAPLAARWLRLAEANPQGTVIVGAHPWARAIAGALQSTGCKVLLIDTNRDNLLAARMENLPTHYGNVLAENTLESLEVDGMGRILALTPNDEVNSLAALHFKELFGTAQLFQLTPAKGHKQTEAVPKHLRGRYLFGEELNFESFEARWAAGARIKSTKLTEEFGYDDFRELYGDSASLLFVVAESGVITVLRRSAELEPTSGQTLIALIDDPDAELPETREETEPEGDEAPTSPVDDGR